MKKTIVIAIAVVLLLCLANPFVVAAPQEPLETASEPEFTSSPIPETDPPPTPTPIYFSDVPPEKWYFECVTRLHELGLANGTGGGLYEPERQVTWAEVLGFLLNGMGVDHPEPEPGQKWGDVYVAPAQENGLISYSFDLSLLYTPITRLDAAHLTARSLYLLPISGPTPFTDCDDPDVTELYEKGIITGIEQPDGTLLFAPDGIFTRAEISMILWKTLTVPYTENLVNILDRWVDVFPNLALANYPPEQFHWPEDDGTGNTPRITYDGGYYAIGIDVSEFMGEIDWTKVAADGIDFVILRCGGRLMQSGTIFEDKYFQANLEGATAAGLDVGIYFFSQALNEAEGIEEAEFVLDILQGRPLSYPIVCDWEFLGGSTCRTWTSNPREVTDGIAAFCRVVEEAGYRAGVYFNEYCGILKMDLSRLAGYPFWFARYTEAPNFLYNFQIWQYGDHAMVDGIHANVDINISFVEDFRQPFNLVPEDPSPAPSGEPAASQDPDASAAPAESTDPAETLDPDASSEPLESPDPSQSAEPSPTDLPEPSPYPGPIETPEGSSDAPSEAPSETPAPAETREPESASDPGLQTV